MKDSWRSAFIWFLKGNLTIWIINLLLFAALFAAGSGWTKLELFSFFSRITLLETGIFFIIGGALAFSGSHLQSKTREFIRKTDEQWSIDKLRKSEKKANKFIILAIILLIESLIISLFGL